MASEDFITDIWVSFTGYCLHEALIVTRNIMTLLINTTEELYNVRACLLYMDYNIENN